MILFYFLVSASAINFYVDPVVYRSPLEVQDTVTQTSARVEDIYYLEFNCEIPYQELLYETIDSAAVAKATIYFKLTNPTHTDSLFDTLHREFSVRSFREAAREGYTFIVQFGLFVRADDYIYDIIITSRDKDGELRSGEVQRPITIRDAEYDMSGLLVASSIFLDTLGGYLSKGNLKVIPKPSHVFNENHQTLYLYYEIYELPSDTGQLDVTYKIADKGGNIVRDVTQKVEKEFKAQAVNVGLNLKGIKPGNYTLSVELSIPDSNQLIRREVPFAITTRVAKEGSFEGMPHYEDIEYFVTANEYKQFKKMSKDGKATYLNKFWANHDYFEITRRFDYVDEHFGQGMKPGSKTERGRIYLKYGAPDEIEKSTIEIEESRPNEQWQYYNGYRFYFVDIRGTNEYTLVWTNCPTEKSQPGFYKYLSEKLQTEIEEK